MAQAINGGGRNGGVQMVRTQQPDRTSGNDQKEPVKRNGAAGQARDGDRGVKEPHRNREPNGARDARDGAKEPREPREPRGARGDRPGGAPQQPKGGDLPESKGGADGGPEHPKGGKPKEAPAGAPTGPASLTSTAVHEPDDGDPNTVSVGADGDGGTDVVAAGGDAAREPAGGLDTAALAKALEALGLTPEQVAAILELVGSSTTEPTPGPTDPAADGGTKGGGNHGHPG